MELYRGSTIPILAVGDGSTPYVEADSKAEESEAREGSKKESQAAHAGPKTEECANNAHAFKLARSAGVPPMCQMVIEVLTEASGLVFLESKAFRTGSPWCTNRQWHNRGYA